MRPLPWSLPFAVADPSGRTASATLEVTSERNDAETFYRITASTPNDRRDVMTIMTTDGGAYWYAMGDATIVSGAGNGSFLDAFSDALIDVFTLLEEAAVSRRVMGAADG